MGFHTFDVAHADRLDDAATRYRYLSVEELVHALQPDPTAIVVDIGSGTGFYTSDIAPHVDQVLAVDLQQDMHQLYRDNGVPSNVSLLTATTALPVTADSLHGAISVMTFHELPTEQTVSELARTLTPGARAVVVDWTAAGSGAAGPPKAERYDLEYAIDHFETSNFEIERAADRTETFLLVARRLG